MPAIPGTPDPLFTPASWAESGTATKPDDTRIDHGWDPADVPPAEYVNYALREAFRRLYIAPKFYSSPEAAYEALTNAKTHTHIEHPCIVDERDTDQQPGTVYASQAGAADVVSVCCTGESVVYATNTDLIERTRDLTAVVQTFVFSSAPIAVYRVITNGKYVVCAYTDGVGEFVECWLRSTGVSQWQYNHGIGTTINDIAMDATRVYLVSITGAANECEAITIATGAVAWTYNHNATLNYVATNGRQVFFSGNASGHASAAKMRAINATNGFDAANEGGTGLDTANLAWDWTAGAFFNAPEALACDGFNLYVASAANGAVYMFNMGNGAFSALTPDGNPLISIVPDSDFLAIDQQFVYLQSADVIYAIDKRSGSIVWNWDHGAGNATSVASDGAAVFQGGSTGGGSLTLARLYRGNRAGLWRVVDPDDNFLPYRQAIIPQEG